MENIGQIKRCFIVFYRANKGNSLVTGYINFITDGCFLNRKKTIEQISESSDGLTQIVITNIIEISESDYNDWNY